MCCSIFDSSLIFWTILLKMCEGFLKDINMQTTMRPPFVASKLVSNNLRGKENAREPCTPTRCMGKTECVMQSKWCMPLMQLIKCTKTSGLSEAHLPKTETKKWLLGNKTKKRNMSMSSFPSKLTNATMTASAVTAAVPSSPQHRPAPTNQCLQTKAITLSMKVAWWSRAHFNNTPVKPPRSTSRPLWMDGWMSVLQLGDVADLHVQETFNLIVVTMWWLSS